MGGVYLGSLESAFTFAPFVPGFVFFAFNAFLRAGKTISSVLWVLSVVNALSSFANFAPLREGFLRWREGVVGARETAMHPLPARRASPPSPAEELYAPLKGIVGARKNP